MYAYFELITIIDFLEFLAVCKFTAFTFTFLSVNGKCSNLTM